MYFVVKIIVSAVIVALVSEIGKRFTWMAALIASLPLTATLSMIWLYHDTRDADKIISLSWNIFWAVIPSQAFFVALPLLLKSGMKFAPAMVLSILIMFAAYTVYAFVLGRFGIKI